MHDDYTQERAVQKNRIRRRGIYLLPNLFTTAALFAGFYAIVQAMNLTFDQAAIAIFVAMVLDSLDGRVARLTKTQSAFGAEYDSLSDMVSFGAAPALVMYEWVLRDMGKLGWIAAFVYCAGAALRLARFNTMLDVADKRWFTGIPSPAAAALVAGCVCIVDDYNVDPLTIKWWAWCVTVFAGLTMVSNLKYWSFKTINLKKSVPFVAIFLIVLAIALLSYQPAIVLFAGFVAYAISGYVVSGWLLLRRRRAGARRSDRLRREPSRSPQPPMTARSLLLTLACVVLIARRAAAVQVGRGTMARRRLVVDHAARIPVAGHAHRAGHLRGGDAAVGLRAAHRSAVDRLRAVLAGLPDRAGAGRMFLGEPIVDEHADRRRRHRRRRDHRGALMMSGSPAIVAVVIPCYRVSAAGARCHRAHRPRGGPHLRRRRRLPRAHGRLWSSGKCGDARVIRHQACARTRAWAARW